MHDSVITRDVKVVQGVLPWLLLHHKDASFLRPLLSDKHSLSVVSSRDGKDPFVGLRGPPEKAIFSMLDERDLQYPSGRSLGTHAHLVGNGGFLQWLEYLDGKLG